MNEKQITKEQILNIFNEICEKISPDNAARYMRGAFSDRIFSTA